MANLSMGSLEFSIMWSGHLKDHAQLRALKKLGRLKAKYGHLTVFGVDKFPRMLDYVIPSGVRIADADRVRLGAHLAHGTTVMHEGFCKFQCWNARNLNGRGVASPPELLSETVQISAGALRSWALSVVAAK